MILVPAYDRIIGEGKYERGWRKSGGRLIHAAAVLDEPLKHNEGMYAVLCCEPDLINWVTHDRTDRHVRDGEKVTCKKCLKRLAC